MSFTDQIKGSNTTLRAVVIFYGSDDQQSLANIVANNTTAVVTMADEPLDLSHILGDDSPPYSQSQVTLYELSPKYFKALKSFPSVKESINIDTRKYSIPSVKLSLINIKTVDGYLSDLLDSDYFRINKTAEIRYYPNNQNKNYYTAYKGKIKYTSHDRETISIELEDSTQDSLYIDVPVNYTPDDENMLPKSRNIPYPMVYGTMKKSPIIYLSNKDYEITDEEYSSQDEYALESKFCFDSPNRLLKENIYIKSETINNSSQDSSNKAYGTNLYIGQEGSYMNLSRYAKTAGQAEDSGDLDNFITGNSTDSFIKLNSESSVGGGAEINDVKSLILRGYILRSPIQLGFDIKKVDGEDYSNDYTYSAFAITPNDNSVSPEDLVFQGGAYLTEEVNSNLSEIISGNKYIALCHESGERLDSIMRLNSGGDYNTLESYSTRIRYNDINFNYACDTYLIANLHFTISGLVDDSIDPQPDQFWVNTYVNIYCSEVEPTIGYIPPTPNPFISRLELLDSWGDFIKGNPTGGYVYGEFEANTGGGMFLWNTQNDTNSRVWNTLDLENLSSSLQNYKGDSGTQGSSKSDSWTEVNKFNLLNINLVAQDLQTHPNIPHNSFIVNSWSKFIYNGFKIYQNAYIDTFWEKDYYADINGRAGGFSGSSTTAESIIRDIISSEIGNPESIDNYDTIGINDVKYAFTQNKKINSKELIEEISSFSNLFPIFKNNKLDIKSIQMSYDNPSFKMIKSKDIRTSSFSRTGIRELYSEIIFNYDYDFSTDSYLTSLTIKAEDVLEGYNSSFYNLNGISKTLDCRFVYDDTSAYTIASYLLMSNCNPHNNIVISLPLSYIDYELGDLVKISSLINNQKMYGEDYSNGAYFVNGQIKYNLFIISSITKTSKDIKINLYQLHNLDIEQPQESNITQVYFCPINNDQMASDNVLELDNWVDWETGTSMVNSYTDGIFTNPATGLATQYIANQDYCLGEDVNDIIYGCTDTDATNYNPDATHDNGSCTYISEVPLLSDFTGRGDFFNFYNSGIEDFNYNSNVFFMFEQSFNEVLDELGGESSPLYNPIFYTPTQLHNRIKHINLGIVGWDSYKKSVNMFILLPDPYKAFGDLNVLGEDSTWDFVGWYIKTQGLLYSESSNGVLNMIFSFNTIRDAISSGNSTLHTSQIPNSGDDGIYRVTIIPYGDKWILKVKIPLIFGGDYLDSNYIPTTSVPHIRYGHAIPPNTIIEGSIEFQLKYYLFPEETPSGMYVSMADNVDILNSLNSNLYPILGDNLFGTLFGASLNNNFSSFSTGFNTITPIDTETASSNITALTLKHDFDSYPEDSHPLNELFSSSGDLYDFLEYEYNYNTETEYSRDFFLAIGSTTSTIDSPLEGDVLHQVECVVSEDFDSGNSDTLTILDYNTNVETEQDSVFEQQGLLLKTKEELRDYIKTYGYKSLEVSILKVDGGSGLIESEENINFDNYNEVESTLIDDGSYSNSTAGETRTIHTVGIEDLSKLWHFNDNLYNSNYKRKLKFEFTPDSENSYYFLRFRRFSYVGPQHIKYKSRNIAGITYFNAIIFASYYTQYVTSVFGPTNFNQYDSPLSAHLTHIKPFHTFTLHTHDSSNNHSLRVLKDIGAEEELENTEEEIVNNEIGIYVNNWIPDIGKEFSLIGNPDNEKHLRYVDGELIPSSLDTPEHNSSSGLQDTMQELGVGLNIKILKE